MKLDELIDQLHAIKVNGLSSGLTLGELEVWANTDDAGYKFPLVSIKVDKRNNRVILEDS